MKIITIEPTPSPQTMKLIVSESLSSEQRYNYTKMNKHEAPLLIQRCLSLEEIKSVYHVSNFLAVEKVPAADWKELLPLIQHIFNSNDVEVVGSEKAESVNEEAFEVRVQLQMLQDLPISFKLTWGNQEYRVGLPSRFKEAIFTVSATLPNVITERTWTDYDTRFGNLEEIHEQLVEEMDALYPDDRISAILEEIRVTKGMRDWKKRTVRYLNHDIIHETDWKKKLQLLDKVEVRVQDIPVLKQLLQDEKMQIRRQVVMYAGGLAVPEIFPLIETALQDASPAVRRTAADCCSDIGDTYFIPVMTTALKDASKIVRWRAAMYCFEVGDERCVDELEVAMKDEAYEVALQAKMAWKRITFGQKAAGSIWNAMKKISENEN